MKEKTIFLFGLSILLITSLAFANDYQLEVESGLVNIQTNDIAPNAGRVGPVALNPGIDSQWDLMFSFDAQIPTGDNQLLGVEFVGDYFWATGGAA